MEKEIYRQDEEERKSFPVLKLPKRKKFNANHPMLCESVLE